MSSNNLHPIYVALDKHQYSRAVKLASALPTTNALGQALLAVALQKSGQEYKTLLVSQRLLVDKKPESLLELHQRLERLRPEQQAATTITQPTAKTKGKKNKKRTTSSAKTTQQTPKEKQQPVDWIHELEHEAVLPENWDKMDDCYETKTPITDETTLSTLAIPLQALRMHMTLYQMYLAACQYQLKTTPKAPLQPLLTKSFESGLQWLAQPKMYPKVDLAILSNLQVTALQLARMSTTQEDMNKYTCWAARAVLWQQDELNVLLTTSESEEERSSLQQKQTMALRLAESLANKATQSQTPPSAQDCWLYIETLTRQKKFEQVLDWLIQVEEMDAENTSVIRLDKQQIRQEKAKALVKLKRFQDAWNVYQELIQQHVDDWSYWVGYLSCCHQHGGIEEALSKGQSLLDSIIQENDGLETLPRGPHLIKVELAAIQVRGGLLSDTKATTQQTVSSSDMLDKLQDAIVAYATFWSFRASCAFSDLEPYVALLVDASKNSNSEKHAAVTKLIVFTRRLQSENRQSENQPSQDTKQERQKLRAYIFAVKLLFALVELLSNTEESLPDWKELIKEWQWSTLAASSDNKSVVDESGNKQEDVVQKENQPGDELVLLAVKRLLRTTASDNIKDSLYIAATLLELAMSHSPHNAYLAISAMDVYARLDATWRSWELYHTTLDLKHIQIDSCAYLILDMLLGGGMYNEIVQESGNILKFHTSMSKDTGDFMGRAMQHGTLSKAHEFLVFHRQRMNRSLSLLDAKRYIMDCAPLVHPAAATNVSLIKKNKGDQGPRPVAADFGIIGGPDDLERATSMAREAHNPLGAPSIVRGVGDSVKTVVADDPFSDNRDFSILSNQMMQPITPLTSEQIIHRSFCSGHVHGLLIRAVLCVDACKGPKKGKITKPADELLKRCHSLLSAVSYASDFCQRHSETMPLSYSELMHTVLSHCRVLVVVCSGLQEESSTENDSLSDRERRATEILTHATTHVQSARTKIRVSETDTHVSVPTICRLLPDFLVAIFALLEMNASMFATFGWGKRKRKTKPAAEAIAEFALMLRQMVSDLTNVLSGLPGDGTQVNAKISEIEATVKGYLEELSMDKKLAKETAQHVVHAQHITRDRVLPYLEHIVMVLGTFDVTDES